ncbi:hypothetical protein D9981_21000 [Pseudoalteromonas phenolica O-BC30]|nr:hypothetical protein D9981_21000 [Pseudoalteromonas phenolica O-BC30]
MEQLQLVTKSIGCNSSTVTSPQ